MAVLNRLFFGILILQIYVNAAPSDVGKLEEIAKAETVGETLDPVKEVEDNANSTQTFREKRYYNPYGYGFPPVNPILYPSFNKRDDFGNTGNYGIEDPIEQIHRHVQEIANYVRQPQPPRIPHVPIFYPVLFVPPFNCNCNPNNNNYQPTEQPYGQPNDEPIDQPTEQPNMQPNNDPNYLSVDDNQNDKVNVTPRFPEMEDDRQNWGFVINRTQNPNQGRPDFNRPISFDPISINQASLRPAPPVEHGTIQSDVTAAQVPSRPQNDPQNSRPPQPSTTRPPFTRPPQQRPQNNYPVGPPTVCDAAIIACCHRPLVVYDCFAIQGCPNITSYGNPCETSSILRIIEKLQKFYASRSG